MTDRQKETASPKGRQNESNQNDYVKKKTKYFPQSILNEMNRKNGMGVGWEGVRGKKRAHATTKEVVNIFVTIKSD